MVEEFSKWMIAVQAGLLATYARWITTGAISPAKTAKALTFVGFGGALVLASLRLGFLSDMAQRLDPSIPLAKLTISYSDWLPNIHMSMLGVPQHVCFFVGVVGFAWSAWNLQKGAADKT